MAASWHIEEIAQGVILPHHLVSFAPLQQLVRSLQNVYPKVSLQPSWSGGQTALIFSHVINEVAESNLLRCLRVCMDSQPGSPCSIIIKLANVDIHDHAWVCDIIRTTLKTSQLY